MSFEHSPSRQGTHPTIAKLLEAIGPVDPHVAQLMLTMPPLELLRIADMSEAQHLSSLSQETLEREYRSWILKLSKRRNGMRVIYALLAGHRPPAAA